VREEKKHHEKEATANAFFDLTKKPFEVEESMAKSKATEAEAKLMVKEREIMLVDTTNMTEWQKAWVEKRRAIELDLCAFAWDLWPLAWNLCAFA
jgi:hypothetical protein